MPVGQGTVSKTIKDTQDKPGSGSQQEADKVQTPGFLPEPSKQVKKDQAGMKNRKEDIKEFIYHNLVHNKINNIIHLESAVKSKVLNIS